MYEFPNLATLALFHTLFCIIILSTKKHRAKYDIIAGMWLIFICLATVRRSFQIYLGDSNQNSFLKIIFYPLTYGPCLYLYTRILTKNEKQFRFKDLFHFLPFFVFTLLSFLPLFSNLKYHRIFLLYAFSISSWISVLVYSCLAYKMIKIHSLNLLDKFSYLSIDNSLHWINRFSLLFLIVLTIQNVISFYTNFGEQKIISGNINGWLLLGFLYVLSFFFIRQQNVFARNHVSEEKTPQKKYNKSGLNEEKINLLSNKLISYMEKEKPYLNPDLVLSDLAKVLEIHPNHLSQVINTRFQKNFFVFINDYRIAEVIQKMNNPTYRNFPILRIAYQAGFNSKSSFNSIFKKSTGLSPLEYRSNIKIH